MPRAKPGHPAQEGDRRGPNSSRLGSVEARQSVSEVLLGFQLIEALRAIQKVLFEFRALPSGEFSHQVTGNDIVLFNEWMIHACVTEAPVVKVRPALPLSLPRPQI